MRLYLLSQLKRSIVIDLIDHSVVKEDHHFMSRSSSIYAHTVHRSILVIYIEWVYRVYLLKTETTMELEFRLNV